MNPIGICFSLINAVLCLSLPRKWAPLPLILGATYIPIDDQIELGPLHFTTVRILIAACFIRVAMRGERIVGGWKRLDYLMVAWAGIIVLATLFHRNPGEQMITSFGVIYDGFGIYLLFRIFLRDFSDLRRVFRMVCIVMMPIGIGMLIERHTGMDVLAQLFGGSHWVEYRNGHYRAHGPFIHAILAGTIGATCLPMAVYLWRVDRNASLMGLFGTTAVVYASGSSGPIMTMLTCIAAMILWHKRRYLRMICWTGIVALFLLNFIMNDPVYYLIARIDITGGSTGYHRAALIQSAINHFGEWWLAGTDYTRHWMPSGIAATPNHTDITNQYIAMGVMGGFGLMSVFIWVMAASFVAVARARKALRLQNAPSMDQFLVWVLGAILFGHVTTFLTISYFGQATTFLYLLIGIIGSLHGLRVVSLSKRSPQPSVERRIPVAAGAL